MISKYLRAFKILVFICIVCLLLLHAARKGHVLLDPTRTLYSKITYNVLTDALGKHNVTQQHIPYVKELDVQRSLEVQRTLNQKFNLSGNTIQNIRAITISARFNQTLFRDNTIWNSYDETQTFLSQRDFRLRELLHDFENWKVQYSDAINDLGKRDVYLGPPPHVKDGEMWKSMISMFPVLFRRLLKPFLLEHKNPCFLEEVNHSGTIKKRCLPYFIEVGAAKCGSTDLYWHLAQHPQVVPLYKEPHFWTHIDKTDRSITHYLDTLERFSRTAVTDYDKKTLIFGDASPSYFWEQTRMVKHSANTKKDFPFLWADVIYTVQPGTKIIAILRNPSNRTISDYFYSGKHQSPEDFDFRVRSAIKRFNNCVLRRPLRVCGSWTYYPRIHISVYIAHILEWIRVFSRQQVMIIRTEDWHDHEDSNILKQIYRFLEIDELDESMLPTIHEEKILKEIEHVKATDKKSRKLGNILPETRKLLDGFFEPYNRQLTNLLGDERFLWKDK